MPSQAFESQVLLNLKCWRQNNFSSASWYGWLTDLDYVLFTIWTRAHKNQWLYYILLSHPQVCFGRV